MNLLYERYHSKSKLQNHIISDDNYTYRNLLSAVRNYIKPSRTILDIGCGVGTIDFYLASKGGCVTGLDISKSAITIANRNADLLRVGNNTKFLISDFPNSKINGEYNMILILEVIEHLLDDRKVIKECYQLLKDGGILILSTRSKNEVLYKLGIEKTHDQRVGHLRRYSVKELIKIISSFGFSVLEVKKTEGLVRDSLFVFPKFGDPIIRVANNFRFFSDLLTFIDNIFLKLFGESQIYIIAKK